MSLSDDFLDHVQKMHTHNHIEESTYSSYETLGTYAMLIEHRTSQTGS